MKISKFLAIFAATLMVTSCTKTPQPTSSEEIYEAETDPHTILNEYYKDLEEWDNYIDLRHKLYNIIYKDFVAIPYQTDPVNPGNNWTVNRLADQSLYNYDKVNLLYSDTDDYKMTSLTTTNWQREHCFPASLMTGKSTGDAVKTIGTATDFHNLYASYSSGNSTHSNISYGNVNPDNGPIKTVGNARYQEDNPGTIKDESVFEPADFDKGRVARAVFYIGLMYGTDNWVNKVDNAGHELSTGIEVVLRSSNIPCTLSSAASGFYKCHSNKEDLVEWTRRIWPDRLELQHNNVVQSFQHNRNPFIDFPELVEYVYGTKQLESGSIYNLHNIYDILDLGNDKVANVAVENVKYAYDDGDTFNSSNDMTVYAVKNNLEKEVIHDYSISGVNDNEVIRENQNGSIVNVSYPGAKSASYKLSVASHVWKESNYVGLPTFDNVSIASHHGITNLNGISWEINNGNASNTVGKLGDNGNYCGITLGSSSTPAETVTIESLDNIAFDDKQVVKGIYIEANSTSSWNGGFTLKIYLDDKLVYEGSPRYSSRSKLQTYGISLSNLNANIGRVRYEFSDVNTGLRIGRLGLVVTDTY